jgi:alkylation response protein AidB-like acyl-CoA dehydrogenase
VADHVAGLVRDGTLSLPRPGSGHTRERWHALTAFAEQSLPTARLAEGHTDALAIWDELTDQQPVPGAASALWGVWAAEPPGTGLTACRGMSGRWLLSGRKAFCSGARSCTMALVTARDGEHRRLFVVEVGQDSIRPVPGSWPAAAMAGSDTLDLEFDDAYAIALGEPGAYIDRPGFHHGGIGVAACWLGGARGVARTLYDAAGAYDVGPHALAHLGAVHANLEAADAVLDRAAAEIDEDPHDKLGEAAVRSRWTRAFVEQVCREVVDRVGRALGAMPLAQNADHAAMVADLTVYLRQHHAERDYAALGQALADRKRGAAR